MRTARPRPGVVFPAAMASLLLGACSSPAARPSVLGVDAGAPDAVAPDATLDAPGEPDAGDPLRWLTCDEVSLPNLSSDFLFSRRTFALPSWCRPWEGVVPVFVNGELRAWRLDGASMPLPPVRTYQPADRAAVRFTYLEIDTTRLADGPHRLELDATVTWSPAPQPLRAEVAVANTGLPAPRFEGALVEVTAAAGLPPPDVRAADDRQSRYLERPFGAAPGDLDGDGDDDLLVWSRDGAQAWCQGAALRFAPCGPAIPGNFAGGGLGDLDNDGDPDAVLVGGEVTILRNDGGALVAVAPDPGAEWQRGGHWFDGVTFADVDADGLLDVAVAHMNCREWGSNVVLRNEGGLRFADVAPALGLDTPGAATFSLALEAPTDDGVLHAWTMVESCTAIPTQHFVFDPGDDLPRQRARVTVERSAPMGSGWLDPDGDGRLHLLASDFQGEFIWSSPARDGMGPAGGEELRLFFNGVGNDPDLLGKPSERWSQVVLDADMDGRADVFMTADREKRGPTQLDLDGLYWAAPDGMRDAAARAGLAGDHPCRAARGADLDGDGDTDLVLGCAGGLRLLRNDLVRSPAARTVILHGAVSNPDGVHAILEGPAGERRLSRGGGQPYAGGVARESLRCPAGQTLRVLWPSGVRQEVPCGEAPVLHVREPAVARVSARRAAAGEAVTVTVDPAALGAPDAAVRVDPSAGAWRSAPARGPDGRWTGALTLPAAPSVVVLTVTVGNTRLRVRPRVFVR